MSVEIPRINRIEPTTAMPKNDRINMQVKDNAAMIMNQTNQIAQIGDQVGDIYQQYENDKIEQISSKAEQDYANWTKQELAKAKNYEGDPTVFYADLDKRAMEKRQEIEGSLGDVSDRVKRHVSSKFGRAAETRQLEIDFQRGAQQETYDHNQFEAQVKFKRNDVAKSAGYVQAGDTSSYKYVDQGLTDIEDTILKRGLKKGSVTALPPGTASRFTVKDEDGNIIPVQLTDVAKVRIAQEKSESVKAGIDALISSGKTAEAQEMREKYRDYLDPKGAAAIDKKFKTASRKDEAYSVVGSLRGLSEDAALSKIDAIQDPEVRSEVLKIKDADDRRIAAMKERKAKVNYSTLHAAVMDKMNSSQPYYGMADLENDPVYKQTWDNLTPTQKKAVEEMVEAPKDSNPKALAKAYELLADPDYLSTATVDDFMEKTAGLTRGERSKMLNQFTKLQNPTANQERQARVRANQLVKDNLLLNDTIRKKNGFLPAGDELTMINYQNKVADWLNNQKVIPSDDQIKAYVKEAVVQDLESDFFKRTPAPVTRQKVPGAPKVDTAAVDPATLIKLQNEYARTVNKGRVPHRKDPNFLLWVEKRG